MSYPWHSFSKGELDELGRAARPLTEPAEGLCPRCREYSVRRYIYEHSGPRRVAMSYVWCPGCRRYGSNVSPPLTPQYRFDDPADDLAKLRNLRDNDLFGLLNYLDELWDDGILPQTLVAT